MVGAHQPSGPVLVFLAQVPLPLPDAGAGLHHLRPERVLEFAELRGCQRPEGSSGELRLRHVRPARPRSRAGGRPPPFPGPSLRASWSTNGRVLTGSGDSAGEWAAGATACACDAAGSGPTFAGAGADSWSTASSAACTRLFVGAFGGLMFTGCPLRSRAARRAAARAPPRLRSRSTPCRPGRLPAPPRLSTFATRAAARAREAGARIALPMSLPTTGRPASESRPSQATTSPAPPGRRRRSPAPAGPAPATAPRSPGSVRSPPRPGRPRPRSPRRRASWPTTGMMDASPNPRDDQPRMWSISAVARRLRASSATAAARALAASAWPWSPGRYPCSSRAPSTGTPCRKSGSSLSEAVRGIRRSGS